MIRSTKGKLIEQVLAGKASKGFPADLFRTALRKTAMLEAAAVLDDLRSPPGNRLETLAGAVSKGSHRLAARAADR